MAINSSLTVSGITPDLSILGAYQEFIYNQNSSAFRLHNTFVPTSEIASETNFEFRNRALSGFRWVHGTLDTDTIGELKLQSFINASPTGIDILSFNNDGSITFLAPVIFPNAVNVFGGATQYFVYNSATAQFILKNDATSSNVRYVLESDSVVRGTFGYLNSTNETSINTPTSFAIYVNSVTPLFHIDSGTGNIEITSGFTASVNRPNYAFTLNNTYADGITRYVIEQNGVSELELGYEDDINIPYIKTTYPFHIIINGGSTCIFNETNFDLLNNSIINASWNGGTINVSKGGTGQTSLTSNALLTGNGTSAITQITPGDTGTVLIGNTGGAPSFSSSPVVDSITINNNPVNGTDGVNKTYVDALYQGIEIKVACYGATTVNLSATYTNGAGGVTAKLTSTSPGIFTVDGLTPSFNSRILVKDQTLTYQNGIYVVLDTGSVSTSWQLMRATDFDQPADINPGVLVPVEYGDINGVTSWIETATVDVIGPVGTNNSIVFTAFTYSPTSFLQKSNNLSDVTNTSTARINLGLTNMATQTVTTNALLVGAASNTINSIALTNGQILIGSTGNTPVASLPSNGTNISWDAGAGSLTANLTGQVAVTNGGTGLSTTTAYGVICGGTTSTDNLQNAGTGNSGEILSSNGNSALPSWKSLNTLGGAPNNVNYIIQTSNASLSNAQSLGSLTTGLVKNTTTAGTGVLSIATAGTDYYVPGDPISANTQFYGRCVLTRLSGQILPNNTWTAAAFLIAGGNTTFYDPSNWWYGQALNYPSRITPGSIGQYLIRGSYRPDDNNNGNTCGIGLYKNGVSIGEIFTPKDGSGRRGSNIIISNATTSTSDYFELRMYQDSGSSLIVSFVCFTIEKLS